MNIFRLSCVSTFLLTVAVLPQVVQAQTTVTLSASPNPSKFGAPVVMTATLTRASASGRVTFYDGVTVLGTKPLVSGAASLATILLPAGSRQLKAYYSGDGSNAAATSNVVTQTVNAQPAFGFLRATVPISSGPLYAVGDFNGDGKADIVTTTFVNSTQTLQILLGDGAGNFQAGFSLPIQGGINAAVAGDFNGDGISDLAYLNQSSTSLTILLGKGDGTFQNPATFALLNFTASLAVGDFNGDGKADLVVADPQTGVDILLGNGDGTFQPPVSYTTFAGNPTDQAGFAAVADFNGDGRADIACVNLQGSVSILLGRGDGTFQPAIQVAVQFASRLFVADFNGDGKADLVTDSEQVLLGKGDGTFQILTPSSSVPLLGVGDFNGDGKTDLLVSNTDISSPTVSILPGNGDGTFQPSAFTTSVAGFSSQLVGDFNGDGRTDIALNGSNAVHFLLGTTVTVIPTGTPQTGAVGKPFPAPLQVTIKDSGVPRSGVVVTFTATLFPGPSPGPSATLSSNTATTDANGVASVTATAGSILGTFPVTATALGFSVQFSLTNATVAASSLTASPTTPQSALLGAVFPLPLQVTALDSSGAPANGVVITFTPPQSGASATLSAGQVVTNSNGVASVIATANQIAGSYVVTATAGGLSTTFALTNVPPGGASLTLTASPSPSKLGSPVTLTTAISNASPSSRVTFFDGITPLGSATPSGNAASFSTVLLSAGTHQLMAYYRDEVHNLAGTSNVVTQQVKAAVGGAFTSQNVPLTDSQSITSVVAGDFNHDGKVDLALLNILIDVGSQITVLLGKGDGSFQNPAFYHFPLTSFGHSLVAADFDRDGNTDLATDGGGILFGNSDGTFRSGAFNIGGPLVVGDFNGDGKPDIVSASVQQIFLPSAQDRQSPHEGGSFTVLLVNLLPGNGDGTFGRSTSLASLPADDGTVVNSVAVADLNGDGKPDVIVLARLSGSSSLTAILGNGDGTGHTLTIALPSGFLSPNSVVAGDFNGDGKPDLALGGLTGAQVPSTAILLGNGDGSFQLGTIYTFGAAAASGDFNGDGFADLVVTGASGYTTGILYGKGDGTFQQGLALSAGVPLAVTDFNGDGKADILTATDSTTVLLGATPAAGQPASITATGGTPQLIAVNTIFPNPLQVTVRDSSGSPVAGITVAFAVPTVGASAILSSATATTNASGVASVTATANNTAGSYNVIASAGTLSTLFSLTNLVGGGANLALGRTATQSSTLLGAPSARVAVDGITDGNFFDGSVTATNPDINAWWQVDLGASAAVSSVVIYNRTDCCSSRLSDYWVFVSNTPFLATDTPATLANRVGIFASHQTTAPSPFTTINVVGQGQYVRVQLTGTDYLSLAEVQVFGTVSGPSNNLAMGKAATQSSTLSGAPAAGVAVDGNTDGNFFHGSVTATNPELNAWWQVDLGSPATINSITIWNRTDCCGSRLSDYWVFVSNTPFLATDTPATLQGRVGVFASHQTTAPSPSTTINVGAPGQYVRVQLTGTDYLSLAEVQVIGTSGPSNNLATGKAATQSSTYPGSPSAGVAVDGNPDGNYFDGSVTATNVDTNAWWQVDLGASAIITSVTIWNRTDCCGSRLNDYWIFISDTPFLATDTPATLANRAGIFASHQTSAPAPSVTIPFTAQGRYVRIQLTGTNNLSLAEVQVFGNIPQVTNLSQGKAASQSSTYPGSPSAGVAVDGNPDGNYFDGSVTATNPETNAWWQVDLGASASINSVVIWNRTDCCGTRLGDYWIFVSNTPFLASDTPATLQNRAGTFASHQTAAPSPSVAIPVSTQGRYVRVQLSGTDYLSLAEVQVLGQ